MSFSVQGSQKTTSGDRHVRRSTGQGAPATEAMARTVSRYSAPPTTLASAAAASVRLIPTAGPDSCLMVRCSLFVCSISGREGTWQDPRHCSALPWPWRWGPAARRRRPMTLSRSAASRKMAVALGHSLHLSPPRSPRSAVPIPPADQFNSISTNPPTDTPRSITDPTPAS